MSLPVLGILGGGQLGRMTAVAALQMGVRVRFLVPEPSGSVAAFGDVTVGDWTDPEMLHAFAAGCTAVTVESEWAPADRLAPVLPDGVALWPSPATLLAIRHKGRQRTVLAEAGLPGPRFACCATPEEALAAAEAFGYPVLLKRYEGSYDGYGNATARTADDLRTAWPKLAGPDGLLVEAFAPFVQELTVLVARRADGAHVTYPLALTEQRDHRCHAVVVPAPVDASVADEARRVALGAVEAVQGVGVTAVELFQMPDGAVWINELAPRPHNTGHYSIEGCRTSQFANHVRAVLGLPLGDPSLREPVAVMVNVLGHRSGEVMDAGYADALAVPGVGVHLYGKDDVRPRRKMGHVTATGADAAETRARAEQAAAAIQL